MAGLVATAPRHLDPAGGDQLAGVLAGAGQPAADQLGVQAEAARRHGQAGSVGRSAVERAPQLVVGGLEHRRRAPRPDAPRAPRPTPITSSTLGDPGAHRARGSGGTVSGLARGRAGPGPRSCARGYRRGRRRPAGQVHRLAGRRRGAPSRRPRPPATSRRRHPSPVDHRADRRRPSPASRRGASRAVRARGRRVRLEQPAEVGARRTSAAARRRRRHQLGQPGDAGQHQQRVAARRGARPRCRCPAGRRPSAAARRRPGARSRRAAAAPACRPPPARPRRTGAASPPWTPWPGRDPERRRDRQVGVAGHPGQPVADPDRRPHDVAPSARPGRSRSRPPPRRRRRRTGSRPALAQRLSQPVRAEAAPPARRRRTGPPAAAPRPGRRSRRRPRSAVDAELAQVLGHRARAAGRRCW